MLIMNIPKTAYEIKVKMITKNAVKLAIAASMIYEKQ